MPIFSVNASANLRRPREQRWHELSNLALNIKPIQLGGTDVGHVPAFDVLATLNLSNVLLDGPGWGRLFVGIQINGVVGWYDYTETSFQATGAHHSFFIQAHFFWDNVNRLDVRAVWALVTGTEARVASRWSKPTLTAVIIPAEGGIPPADPVHFLPPDLSYLDHGGGIVGGGDPEPY